MPSAPPVPIVERPVTPLPPAAPAETPDLVPTPPAVVSTLVQTALDLRGTPYRNGGSDPRGFDCSGFTQWVFARTGVRLPRETREQYVLGDVVEPGTQQPGDLVFFRTTSKEVSHVGIVLGDDRFVHAPSSRGVVRVESMNLPYWRQRLMGIRRLVEP